MWRVPEATSNRIERLRKIPCFLLKKKKKKKTEKILATFLRQNFSPCILRIFFPFSLFFFLSLFYVIREIVYYFFSIAASIEELQHR